MSVGKLKRYALPYSNVIADGTATNTVTPGRTLENFQLKLGGTALTKAMISLFKMKANGKVIVEGTGLEIDALNKYRGEFTDAAFLDVFFADYSLNNELDRMVGSLDTSLGLSSITTEVKIAGATAPVITPILIESAQQKDRNGAMLPYAPMISKVLRYPFSQATGGNLPVTVPFGKVNGAIIKRLHVFHTGNMVAATVKEDSVVVFESTKDENEFLQKRHGRVPQANVFTIDFVVDGDIRKALDARNSNSLEWLFEFSGADNGNIVIEYLDPLGNL